MITIWQNNLLLPALICLYIESHSPLGAGQPLGPVNGLEEAMTSPLEQKKLKITGPVVVTANRVGDGAVVYRRTDGGWTTDLSAAAVTTDASTARELIHAAAADGRRAVDPYAAPVKLTGDGEIRPGRSSRTHPAERSHN